MIDIFTTCLLPKRNSSHWIIFFLITKHSVSDEIFIWQYFVFYLQFIKFCFVFCNKQNMIDVFLTCFLFKMKHVFIISFFNYIVKTFDFKIGIFIWKYFIIFVILLVLTCVLQQNKKIIDSFTMFFNYDINYFIGCCFYYIVKHSI